MVQVIDKATIADPKTHYGSPKASTRRFITQRLTGAINAVLTIFLVWFVISLAGRTPAEMLALTGNPFVALGLALMVIVFAIHMRNGMRDVIEDYFAAGEHGFAMVANNAATALFVVVALGAILKIVFWG
jgi:succinate dehydrogenase / fumarate reductase membrane anchor subunit